MSKIIIVKDGKCNEIALEFHHTACPGVPTYLNITQRTVNLNTMKTIYLTEKQMKNLRNLLTIKIQSMEKANG